MTLGRVEISGGALLMWALLYYMDNGGVAPWVLLGCICHELGHCLAVCVLGGRVSRLRLTFAGAELRLSVAGNLSHGQMLLVALAGPATNLLLAFLAMVLARYGSGGRLYLFAGINLGLAGFNLLPAGWLDGGMLLRETLAWLGREELGEKLTSLCSVVAVGLLLGFGGILLWHSRGRNFTLLLAGGWMLWWARQEHQGAFIENTIKSKNK